MKARTLFLIGLTLCPAAFAQLDSLLLGPNKVGERVQAADRVVDATIQSVRSVEYRFRTVSEVCGYIFEATITESFKGERAGTIVFASNQPLEPGSRQLLFLRNFDEFWSDSSVIYTDPEDPGFNANLVEARKSCVAGLPRLKISYIMQLTPSRDGRQWFAPLITTYSPGTASQEHRFQVQQIAVNGVAMKPDSYRSTIEIPLPGPQGRRVVEWSVMRRQLLEFDADAVQPPLAAPLEQWEAAARRNLDRRLRDFAGSPALVASIKASQRAWEVAVKSHCSSLSTAWPDSDIQAELARKCRKGLTIVWAGELDLLAYEPKWYLSPERGSFGHGNCDHNCRSDQLKAMTDEISSALKDGADWFDNRQAVTAAVETTRKAMENWSSANCRMIATRWPERSLQTSLGERCRHVMLAAWNEASFNYRPNTNHVLRELMQAEKARAAQGQP